MFALLVGQEQRQSIGTASAADAADGSSPDPDELVNRTDSLGASAATQGAVGFFAVGSTPVAARLLLELQNIMVCHQLWSAASAGYMSLS